MVDIQLRRCASQPEVRSPEETHGTPEKAVYPENRAAGAGEAISHSDCAHQAPGHLSCSDLGRGRNTGPTESAPLGTACVPGPEWLRPGKCILPRAGLRQFLAKQPRA